MTNTSVTLQDTGIADAVNDVDGPYESARNRMFALDTIRRRCAETGPDPGSST